MIVRAGFAGNGCEQVQNSQWMQNPRTTFPRLAIQAISKLIEGSDDVLKRQRAYFVNFRCFIPWYYTLQNIACVWKCSMLHVTWTNVQCYTWLWTFSVWVGGGPFGEPISRILVPHKQPFSGAKWHKCRRNCIDSTCGSLWDWQFKEF